MAVGTKSVLISGLVSANMTYLRDFLDLVGTLILVLVTPLECGICRHSPAGQFDMPSWTDLPSYAEESSIICYTELKMQYCVATHSLVPRSRGTKIW